MALQISNIRALLLLMCVVYAFSDCYRMVPGCRDKDRKTRYRVGQRWKPKSNTCYTCRCMRRKVIALTCKVAVEDTKVAVLKSSKPSSKAAAGKMKSKDTMIKIRWREAKTKKCPPTKAPSYNWWTGTFEEVTYKTVKYFYYKKGARCCNRSISFASVHPSCKVVKVGNCGSKVVQRKNPKKLCEAPMSFVG